REHVVVDVVLVWKVDRRSLHDGEHVWNETLIVLSHTAVAKAFDDVGRRGKLRRVALEIDHHDVELGERLVGGRNRRNRADAGISVDTGGGPPDGQAARDLDRPLDAAGRRAWARPGRRHDMRRTRRSGPGRARGDGAAR